MGTHIGKNEGITNWVETSLINILRNFLEYLIKDWMLQATLTRYLLKALLILFHLVVDWPFSIIVDGDMLSDSF